MSELITRTARLVPYAKRPKQVPSFVTAYAYEPLADDPAVSLGNLYVVIEVLVGGRSSEEVADLVIENFGEHYYNEPATDTEPLLRFEAAVKATNHELSQYVSQGKASWIGKMSAVVAVQIDEEIHLTQTGSAEGFLYRGKSTTRIAAATPDRQSGPSKTFGSIASGLLEAGDRLLFATPALVHQLPLNRLHTVVSSGTPNSAINEMMELLKGAQSDRVAALVIEITTPELAAVQTRTDEPSEVQLGLPENALDAAKMAATPLAHATVESSRKVGGQAVRGWSKAKPHVQRMGYAGASALRDTLAHSHKRRILAASAAVVVLATAGIIVEHQSANNTKTLMSRFNADYSTYLKSATLASTQKQTAITQLTNLVTEIKDLQKANGHSQLDAKLKKVQLVSGEPSSVAGLLALTSGQINTLEGLVTLTPTTLVALPKDAKPTHMEYFAGNIYVFDTSNKAGIYVVDSSTKSVKTSSVTTAKIGQIIATTLSSAGDGVYLLTSQPGVWFYRFDNDTLTQQTINQGTWPMGSGIASYGGNIYLLNDQGITKHVKTYSGYSPKSDYLTNLADPKAIAVDGNVYVLTPSSLSLYLAGSLKTTADVPSGLTNTTQLRSVAGGNILIGTDLDTNRVGTWDDTKSLVFSHQYAFSGIQHIYDATYDDKSKTAYAAADDKIITFSLK